MSSVSIKEVARLANVSIATVSRCLNDPARVRDTTRKRVEVAIEQTGYSPNTLAQSFRRGKTNVIMVVIPSIGDPFFSGVIRGIHRAARMKGYSVMIHETQLNSMTADEIGAMVVSRQIDGLILLASMSPFGTRILSENSRRALPIVVACEMIDENLRQFPGVLIDNVFAAREATEHLLALGHQRIAFVGGQKDTLLTSDREKGYRKAMLARGFKVADEWLLSGELKVKTTVTAVTALFSRPADTRPTAIFCANDEMALAAMHAIKQTGLRIPEDVSVVGFDDMRFAEIADPPLTTVRQPAENIGERSLLRLCDAIEQPTDKEQADQQVLSHKLIVRKSTGPCAS